MRKYFLKFIIFLAKKWYIPCVIAGILIALENVWGILFVAISAIAVMLKLLFDHSSPQ